MEQEMGMAQAVEIAKYLISMNNHHFQVLVKTNKNLLSQKPLKNLILPIRE